MAEDQFYAMNEGDVQFANDLHSFLKARAEGLVDGGLLAFIHGVDPNGNKDTSKITLLSFELLGSCLVDLAKKGPFDISQVDSFNLPKYFPFHDELKALVERNQDFSLERMEILDNPPKRLTNPDPKSFATFMRVLIEGLLQNHFGSEIMDELFKRHGEKVEESGLLSDPNENSLMALVLLKCKRMTI
ncbi:unnamed protein product [Fraxinus pennsylvanica]|uniref:Uncharacterized protein n=1 Tax=Fraxinus pennsylvanica TaxID=56036 RepID=A0AAD1ZHI4_9LAMI|nr:unnamed protein product [Fraxinus pennsylvanica]